MAILGGVVFLGLVLTGCEDDESKDDLETDSDAGGIWYCELGDSCWPNAEAWQGLSENLGAGVLKEIADVSVIHPLCVDAISKYGGVTANQVANGTCIFAAACVYQGCKTDPLGAPNVPAYSVRATQEEHVQAAVNFARQNHIRIAVKTTGASYSAADQQPGGILIWMSNFKKYSENGVVETFTDSCGTDHGPVLKVGGGETWGDVFNALAADGKYMASSGAAVTVGASGGWLQGGGLGPFDRSLGLGVDNVVSFEVVLPDGSLVTANACSESDLFWALRGGGGGNWGVVVSQTSKVHPVQPLVRANLVWMGAAPIKAAIASALPPGTPDGLRVPLPLPTSIGVTPNVFWTTNTVAADTITRWHDVLLNELNPATMDNRLDGYYGIGCAWGGGFMCADLYFRGSMAEFETAFLVPLRAALELTDVQENNVASGDAFAYAAKEYASYYTYASQDCISAQEGTPEHYVCNTVGYPSANGYNADTSIGAGDYESRLSWMLPVSLFSEPTKAKEFFANPYMAYATGHVLGGKVNSYTASETAVHPHMRTTAMEILLPAQFDPSSSMDPSDMPNLREVLSKHVPPPAGSPIFNHDARNLNVLKPLGEAHGLNWQQMYWGDNLARLQSIKGKYDPTAIFTCRDCVTAVP